MAQENQSKIGLINGEPHQTIPCWNPEIIFLESFGNIFLSK